MEPLQATLANLDREESRLQTIRTSSLHRTRRILVIAASETLVLGFLTGLGAALLFAGSIVRRMEDLQVNARAMRKDLQLADDEPSKDEIGEVKRELTLTSERLAGRTRELRERESELRAIIDNTTAVIYIKDTSSRFLVVNRALEEAFDLPPGTALGKLCDELFRPDVAEKVRANDLAVLQSGQPAQFEEEMELAGEKRTYLSVKVPLLDEAGTPYAICGVSTDITARQQVAAQLQQANDELENRVAARTSELFEANRRLQVESTQHRRTAESLQKSQDQLLRAQRVEIVGTVAGGIAHEFNNVLTAVMGHASLLAPGDEHRDKILQLAERAAALSRQLVGFGRIQPNDPQQIYLYHLIEQNEPMLRSVIGDSIQLEIELEPELGPVKADPVQLQQLLLELVVNARDAMSAGGRLTIALRAHQTPPGESDKTPPWIQLSVSDTGTGIAPEVRSRLFEPFFTTKPPGQGTGLGLASVALIAEQNNGWLDCDTEEGRGSTFTLYLPLAAPALPVDRPVLPPARQHGNETVLVVEDEPAVGEIVALLLRNLGYKTILVENGEAAERAIAAHPGEIDLVLTDLNMPRLNGRELISRLSRSNPNLRVIVTSGSDRLLDDEIAPPLEVEVAFLPKPFSREGLAEKVRLALRK